MVKPCNASLALPTMFTSKGFAAHALDAKVRPVQLAGVDQLFDRCAGVTGWDVAGVGGYASV